MSDGYTCTKFNVEISEFIRSVTSTVKKSFFGIQLLSMLAYIFSLYIIMYVYTFSTWLLIADDRTSSHCKYFLVEIVDYAYTILNLLNVQIIRTEMFRIIWTFQIGTEMFRRIWTFQINKTFQIWTEMFRRIWTFQNLLKGSLLKGIIQSFKKSWFLWIFR